MTFNKAMKNRPQKAWAGLANARLLLRRYTEIESGLKSLQNKIINDKENIRKQCVENGLENR